LTEWPVANGQFKGNGLPSTDGARRRPQHDVEIPLLTPLQRQLLFLEADVLTEIVTVVDGQNPAAAADQEMCAAN